MITDKILQDGYIVASKIGNIYMTEATNKIMKMINSAEDKMKSLHNEQKRIEDKLKDEKAQLHRDAARVGAIIADSNRSAIPHLVDTAKEKSRVMDFEHELAEIKKKIADADKKISDMKHWTSQSEYQDEQKQSEAVSYATKSFRSI